VAYALLEKQRPNRWFSGPSECPPSPTELRVVGQARSMGRRTPRRPSRLRGRKLFRRRECPKPGFIAPDFHCENMRGVAVDWLEWQAPRIAFLPPRFALRRALDRLEPDPVSPKVVKTRRPDGATMHRVVEAIAAGLFVTVGLWFGAGAAKTLRKTAVVGHEISAAVGGARAVGGAGAGVNAAPATGVARRSLSWVRSAISKRATVELTDTFHAAWNPGMPPLGVGPRLVPQSRRVCADGPTGSLPPVSGPLGLPAGILWPDREQEHGLGGPRARHAELLRHEVHVVEPGLRPIIAIVHYPVVGGKKGTRWKRRSLSWCTTTRHTMWRWR